MSRKRAQAPRPVHPTRQLLIDTTMVLLDQLAPEEITSEDVLHQSGISRGSLYHHFEDFAELLAAAQVARFAEVVDQSIVGLTKVLTTVTDRASLLAGLSRVTAATQAPERAAMRFERARALATAGSDERMRRMLGVEQARLTDALTDLIREAQEQGLYRKGFDPRACAVLIQSYTLGKVVDDVVDTPVDPEAWNDLISQIIDRVFAAPAETRQNN